MSAPAQVKRVVYGASEDKRGFRRHGNLLHPRTELDTGILAEECAGLMQQFFAQKRK